MHYTVEEAIPRHARNKDDPNTDVHVVNQVPPEMIIYRLIEYLLACDQIGY